MNLSVGQNIFCFVALVLLKQYLLWYLFNLLNIRKIWYTGITNLGHWVNVKGSHHLELGDYWICSIFWKTFVKIDLILGILELHRRLSLLIFDVGHKIKGQKMAGTVVIYWASCLLELGTPLDCYSKGKGKVLVNLQNFTVYLISFTCTYIGCYWCKKFNLQIVVIGALYLVLVVIIGVLYLVKVEFFGALY